MLEDDSNGKPKPKTPQELWADLMNTTQLGDRLIKGIDNGLLDHVIERNHATKSRQAGPPSDPPSPDVAPPPPSHEDIVGN